MGSPGFVNEPLTKGQDNRVGGLDAVDVTPSIVEKGSSQPDDLDEQTDEDQYLHGRALVFMVLSLMVAVLIIALDGSIISTAIPVITTEFNSLNDVAWYGSIYLLAQMSFQPTFAKSYTFFNQKWVYLGAGVLFEVGSVICAAAPNSTAFIVGRAVAGLGAAGIFAGGMIILSRIVEMRKRPVLLGIVTSMYGVASVIGPTLGGIFTHSARLTWRFCFWINLPLGALMAVIVCFYYPTSLGGALHQDRPLKAKLLGLGLKSALILTGTLVCLILALQWGGSVYPWSDSRVWGLFLGFGLLGILFIFVQYRQKDEALIPLRVLSQRSVGLGCIFSTLLQGGMLAQTYYLPFYFQAARGTDAQTSGLSILPYGVTTSISTLITGALITLTGFYVPFMWLGSCFFVTGSGLLYTLSRSSPFGQWFGYQLLTGAGFGMMVQIPITAVQVILGAADIPIGSTLVLLAQCLGGSVGLAVAQNVFQNSLREKLGGIQGINVPAVEAAGGANLQEIVPASLLVPVRDVFRYAVSQAFLVSVGLGSVAFLASLGIQQKRINTKKAS
ncbi:hypothetical protein FE257_009138 [Aspergillus nanangensis]|uniref:Major facilitator superfamily (MFS) profile domain-containing protein n=1 Tax=Aspergillus nanangensis TaxID=2582783 RepID=A0AAD4CWT0_ASPNN|nr:hypothetical protein FE257_009138 [Aspergillus nanangensis]